MLNEIDLSRIDLNLLALFETVLGERHVGRAADRLNLSPSAVSHGLGRLRRLFNDPLFLRTPRGVVPTERSLELAEPVADILARIRTVLAVAEPFDPATSTRRFTIGAPDAVSAAFLSALVNGLRRDGPDIAIGIRQLLPVQGETDPWRNAFADLETRALDVAVIPSDQAPARFATRHLYDETFVVAMRRGHAYADEPTLDRFCAMRHLLVSSNAEPFGFVDRALAEAGRSRRIALTVPNFIQALATVAETDLIAALPARLVARHAARFDLVWRDLPVAQPPSHLTAIVPQSALADAGVAWLIDRLAEATLALPST